MPKELKYQVKISLPKKGRTCVQTKDSLAPECVLSKQLELAFLLCSLQPGCGHTPAESTYGPQGGGHRSSSQRQQGTQVLPLIEGNIPSSSRQLGRSQQDPGLYQQLDPGGSQMLTESSGQELAPGTQVNPLLPPRTSLLLCFLMKLCQEFSSFL